MKKLKPVVDKMLHDLHSLDHQTRRNAAQNLGLRGDISAVEPLIYVLAQDENWTVRCRAAVALGRLQDERALEPLIHAMRDSNGQLLKHTHYALVKFDERALPALNFYVSDSRADPCWRNALINVLGAIGAESSFFCLVPQLRDNDFTVRIGAIYALAQLKNPRVVDKLLEVLESPEVGPRPAFLATGAGSLHTLTDPTAHILKAVVEALAVFNDKRSASALIGLFRVQNPFGQRAEVLVAATNALRQMSNVHSCELPELNLLLHDPDALKRAAAAISLSWLGDERGVDMLRGVARDPDAIVRQAGAWALRTLRSALGYRPHRVLAAAYRLY